MIVAIAYGSDVPPKSAAARHRAPTTSTVKRPTRIRRRAAGPANGDARSRATRKRGAASKSATSPKGGAASAIESGIDGRRRKGNIRGDRGVPGDGGALRRPGTTTTAGTATAAVDFVAMAIGPNLGIDRKSPIEAQAETWLSLRANFCG